MSIGANRPESLSKLSEERLREIEARAAAATPGPWVVAFSEVRTSVHSANGPGICLVYPQGAGNRANRELIAQARTDLPSLVAEVRRLRHALSVAVVARAAAEAELAGLRRRLSGATCVPSDGRSPACLGVD